MNCLNCQSPIPHTIVINNQEKRLGKRKYCLICSPFGMHNTRKIFPGCKDQKFCKVCNNPLPSRRRNICNACHVAKYRQNVKRKLVEYRGGKCLICGYNRCISNMVFHHRDPSKKEFGIGGKSQSFNRLKNEVNKCSLLCANCHGEVHAGLVNIPL